MEVSGTYLTIESVKKAGIQSFSVFLAHRLMELIDEHGGDYTHLDKTCDDGGEWVRAIISEYEEGARL